MARNPDLQALRDYVMADTGAQNQASSTVRLLVTHSNLKARFLEIRLDLHVSALCAPPQIASPDHHTAADPELPPPRRCPSTPSRPSSAPTPAPTRQPWCFSSRTPRAPSSPSWPTTPASSASTPLRTGEPQQRGDPAAAAALPPDLPALFFQPFVPGKEHHSTPSFSRFLSPTIKTYTPHFCAAAFCISSTPTPPQSLPAAGWRTPPRWPST